MIVATGGHVLAGTTFPIMMIIIIHVDDRLNDLIPCNQEYYNK